MKDGTTYRILSDQVGSVRLVVNADTGAVVQRIDYDAFGNPSYVTGPPDFQPFGFAGGLTDLDTGLVRFGARDYDPRVGRWTSKDPIGFGGDGENLYAYVLQDPANHMDPEGLFLSTVDAWCATHPYACAAAGGALGGAATSAALQYATTGCISGAQVARDAAIGGALGVGFAHLALARAAAQAGQSARGAAGIAASNGTRVTGFTRHGIDRAIGDGVSRAGTRPGAILDALRNPRRIFEGIDNKGRPFQVFQGRDARVVVNPQTGRVVSTNPLSSAGAL